MNNIALLISLWSLAIVILSIFFHEIGHVLMLYRFKKPWQFTFQGYHLEIGFSGEGLIDKEIAAVYLGGIITGLLPLLLFFFFPVAGTELFIIALVFYAHLSVYDIRELRQHYPNSVKKGIEVFFFHPLTAVLFAMIIILLIGWLA